MGDIFAHATEVVCWLGRSDSHLGNALELHRRLPPLINEYGFEALSEKSPAELDVIFGSQKPQPSHSAHTDFQATETLYESCLAFWQRTWFSRLWVAQEVAVASSLLFLCADHELVWPQMVNVAKYADRVKAQSWLALLLSTFGNAQAITRLCCTWI